MKMRGSTFFLGFCVDFGRRKKPRLDKEQDKDVREMEPPKARFSDLGGIESVLEVEFCVFFDSKGN